jgi:drug/metabolite transporter (DMT)-like permease
MFTLPIWSLLTIGAAALQTARNVMQRNLSGPLGLIGATSARFVYGLPFAILYLCLIRLVDDTPLPTLPRAMFGQTCVGAAFQIIGTILMLVAMQKRNFAVVTAFTRTDMVQAAAFGFVILGDGLNVATGIGVVFATIGVIFLTLPAYRKMAQDRQSTLAATGYGLSAAAAFSLAAVFYRGAALSLENVQFMPAAAIVLGVALGMQSVFMVLLMATRNRQALAALLAGWRPSLMAGFFGASASLLWFAAMTLETAARVKTLGLVELLFAMAISGRLLREKLSLFEISGIVCIGAGAILAIV